MTMTMTMEWTRIDFISCHSQSLDNRNQLDPCVHA